MTTWESELKDKPRYEPLQGDARSDVAIIGGGITGILNAYLLSKLGKKVILVEKNELLSNATICTTAFLTEVIDSDLREIASLFGEETARTVWQSHETAISTIEGLIRDEKIDCELMRCPDHVFARTERQLKELEQEFKTYQKLGIHGELIRDRQALPFSNFGHLKIPDQGKFDPVKFALAIAKKAVENGAIIHEHTEVTDIQGDGPVRVTTPSGTIVANDVIIATYKPIINEKTHLKKGMYRSYVMELSLPKGRFEEAIYEDCDNPYHYFRIDSQSKNDRMIIGGEDHKDVMGDTLDQRSFEGLERFLQKFLEDTEFTFVKRWEGPIHEPSDGLALIGAIQPHHYVATAFSGNGMTYSAISALIFRDLISGKENPWAKVYTPERAHAPQALGCEGY